MTVPTEYQQANIAFYNFLTDVRDQTIFDSTHPAYTIAQGVFQAFRRRPLRLIRIPVSNEKRAQANYAPDNAIEMVAGALRRNVDREAFDRALATLPEGAAEFWKG